MRLPPSLCAPPSDYCARSLLASCRRAWRHSEDGCFASRRYRSSPNSFYAGCWDGKWLRPECGLLLMPLLGGPGACRLWRTGLSLSSAGQGQRCPRPVRGTAPWVSGSRRNALVCTVDAIAAFARPPPTDEPALARHCVATHAPCTHSRRQPHRAARPGPRRHATPTRHGRAGVGARLSFSAGEAQPHSLSFRFQH